MKNTACTEKTGERWFEKPCGKPSKAEYLPFDSTKRGFRPVCPRHAVWYRKNGFEMRDIEVKE